VKWVIAIWAFLLFATFLQRKIIAAYYDRLARHYSPDPDEQVFTEEPAEVKKLTGGKLFSVGHWATFSKSGVPVNWYRRPNEERRALVDGEAFCGGPIVLLHGLTGPQGERRVVIELNPLGREAPEMHTASYFQYRVCQPTTLWQSGKMITCKRIDCPQIDNDAMPADDFRVYAGVADPNDASKFSAKCSCGGSEHVISGQLRSDDTLAIWFDGQPL